MRNENLELAQSSGSESSPSWASNTPRPSNEFAFDFPGQGKTIDEITNRIQEATIRSSRSSEVLSDQTSESTPSSTTTTATQFLFPTTRKTQRYGSADLPSSASLTDDKSSKPGAKGESKIARFLRRTQSANEDHCSASAAGKCAGESSTTKEPSLDKIDDTEDARARRKLKIGTDMKFRLGFLKRRHTEGTIHSTSVRPQPEEAQKWANSFSDLMASKYGQALFKAFLQREFSDENIEFWIAVEEYRKSRQNKLGAKAQKIFNDFIVPQAPKEVNLDSITREGLTSKIAQPNHTTFDQAQKRIQGLLEADAYIRFLKSDLYLELLHPEQYQAS